MTADPEAAMPAILGADAPRAEPHPHRDKAALAMTVTLTRHWLPRRQAGRSGDRRS